MNKFKILFLGASFSQVPIIKYAKEKGLYIITVDNLPTNPGHKYADKSYNVSTVNQIEILKLSKRLEINAICAFASDPSALTAAFVSEKLGLKGNSINSVNILSDKSIFRKFLFDNEILSPKYITANSLEGVLENFENEKSVIKPVDSSGSKGVYIVENKQDIIRVFQDVIENSRSNKVILEKFVARKGPQIHGEGFVENGKLIFLCLGDQWFSNVNNMAPSSTIVPSTYNDDIIPKVELLVQDIIEKVGYQNGGINVEVIRGVDDEIYVLEIGARNGGNFMPQLIAKYTSFNIVKANLDILLGNQITVNLHIKSKSFFAQIILHSKYNGVINEVCVPPKLKGNIIEENIYYQKGDIVKVYRNSKDVVGVIILELKNQLEFEIYEKSLVEFEWVKVDRKIDFKIEQKKMSKELLISYFTKNSLIFIPPLNLRVDINKYSEKLSNHSEQFCVNLGGEIIGLLACYFNDTEKVTAYISSISIIKAYQELGIGSKLLKIAIEYAEKLNFKKIRLQVNSNNFSAITLYLNNGFLRLKDNPSSNFLDMELLLSKN